MQGGNKILKYIKRKSIRWPQFDYHEDNGYFITICVKDRDELLGEVINEEMKLNENGYIVEQQWLWLEKQYEQVHLDQYAVMPNHFHGIIFIDNDRIQKSGRGGSRPARINGTDKMTQTGRDPPGSTARTN
jgi:hypothetical protein